MSTAWTQPTVPPQAAAAFDEIATAYDEQWTKSRIGRLQRQAVWRCTDELFESGQYVLDLGCGTGVDAVHLAQRGVRVHAIDASRQMTAVAGHCVKRAAVEHHVTLENLAIEDLAKLAPAGSFDGALSNFGALNCVRDLRPVAEMLADLVRPGGRVALCTMGRFCLGETIWYLLHLRPSKAFRRLRGQAEASIGPGRRFAVHYPTVRHLRQVFSHDFRLVDMRGVGIFVPPSYASPSGKRFGRGMTFLAGMDRTVETWRGFRAIGDHRLLVFERV